MTESVRGDQGGHDQPGTTVRRHVWVSGRVQGVYFRQSCAMEAAKYSVAGWVRNLPEGGVEGVFEGPTSAVEAMVNWCRTGPRYAVVRSVEVRSEPAQGHTTFSVRT